MNNRIPLIIYVFALCAFILGFTEFVTIGLVSNISMSLHTNVSIVGYAVTTYALGAVIGAPGLTAIMSRCTGKRLLLVAMVLFSLGNIIVSLSNNLPPILVARFISGLGHGLFLAVASSIATQLVGAHRSGRAIAIIFGGLTLALAFGVPLGTYLANILTWQIIFMLIAGGGVVSVLGLLLMMPSNLKNESSNTDIYEGLKAMLNTKLLAGAGVTVLAYAGSFALYTYITPILLHITIISEAAISFLMLSYGVMAAIGNILGGYITDRKGANYTIILVLVGLLFTLLLIWVGVKSIILMVILVGLLGALTYAAVPALQTRIINLAHDYAPKSLTVAAGLNIAGFNGGIALGSILGGIALENTGLISTALIGAVLITLGILWMYTQLFSDNAVLKK